METLNGSVLTVTVVLQKERESDNGEFEVLVSLLNSKIVKGGKFSPISKRLRLGELVQK